MKSIVGHAAALCAWALFATVSLAQYPGMPYGGVGGQFARPAVSPYLNILRGGDPAINYYGLVRPQVAFGRAFQTLGDNVVALETNTTNLPPQTGHRSSFMTQGQYFMNNGASGYRQGGQQRPPISGQANQMGGQLGGQMGGQPGVQPPSRTGR